MPPTPSSFLAFDIGNTAVKGGLYADERLVQTFLLPVGSAEKALHSNWAAALRGLLAQQGTAPIHRAGIASVVPATTALLQAVVQEVLAQDPFVLRPDQPLPLQLAYETPQTLGMDRLAAAVAAWTHFRTTPARPLVVVDAGTAVTYEVIAATGTYLGGAIAPGPALLIDSLHRGTAQLPTVPLVLPEHPIGASTASALQSGVLFGFLDAVDGMCRRLAGTLGTPPVCIATGGWGRLLSHQLDVIDHYAPNLVLDGVRVAASYLPDTPGK